MDLDLINKKRLDRANNPELLVISGSKLYGTERYDEYGSCLSDTDLRAVYVPSWEQTSWLDSFSDSKSEQITLNDSEDHLVFSLKFFIEQLLSANPQFIEMFFAPEDKILKITDIGKELLSLREAFITKKFYKRLTGFAYSEFRKACGEKLNLEKTTIQESQAWDQLREIFSPKWGNSAKEIADEVKSLIYSKHKAVIVPSIAGLSNKRLEEYSRYGYCSSSACHSLRILREATELLSTGKITFPRPDAEQLVYIKTGKSNLAEFKVLYESAKLEAEDAFQKSTLPEFPDKKKIVDWFYDVTKDSLRGQLCI